LEADCRTAIIIGDRPANFSATHKRDVYGRDEMILDLYSRQNLFKSLQDACGVVCISLDLGKRTDIARQPCEHQIRPGEEI
jgi:hypothetical protein